MIALDNITGKKFAILGLGKTGLATAAALRASKADFVLWDDNAAAHSEADKAGYKTADLTEVDAKSFTALIMSPGIPHTYPSPHPAAAHFKAASVPIIGDIELLFRACPKATYIGITGTNGKSTTTALIAHILKTAGRKVQVGGNLGTPVLALDPLGADGIYVLELSSYQLELIEQNPIRVAVLLNITPDHLDRHGGMEGYVAAKRRIIATQSPQTLVIGSGEPETRALALQAGKQGNIHIEHIEDSGLEKLIAQADLPTLPGSHNWQNAGAAFLACRALGIEDKNILQGLRSFPGLDHRQQLIREIADVRFVNDSKATNADAASKALACYENIYWIIGGKPKEGGLDGLESLMPRVRHAFIIGAATKNFAEWCEKNKVTHTICGTLDVALQKAATMAWHDKAPGAVVLLSPACASFDQFANFEERGRKFADMVRLLPPPP
jgi:UDP-N-acetylmuramoylalanine--D-glutamate ligase